MPEITDEEFKSVAQLIKALSIACKIDGCNCSLTPMKGPGSLSLCRSHQLNLRENGGMGRMDRPHTFHRKWICSACNTNILEDPRLADITDEVIKRRVARVLMHGDHIERKADGGDDSVENIKSLCSVCHAKKTILIEDYKNK